MTDGDRKFLAKQKLKGYYGNVSEKQLRKYYAEAIRRSGDTSENLIGLLETRLDAVVYRMKFVPTVFAARQFVNHGHILVNGKHVNIPSYLVKEGDVIEVREKSRQLASVLEAQASTEREVPEYMGTLDKLAEQINAPIIAADATSVEDLEKVFTEAQEKLGGKIDFVLHSVAMSPNVRKHRTYDDLDYNFLNKTLDISAISFHKMLQVAKKLDAINEWGSVVALTYVASQRTFFGYNDMADAKSMLESIARSFGYIYGREKHVRINTISQSPTATTAGKGIKDIENMMDFADKMSPLGNAVAEDCANYCVMMFSDFTRKVTMQNLFHDGGFSSMGMSLRAMNQYAKDMTPYEDENGKVIYG